LNQGEQKKTIIADIAVTIFVYLLIYRTAGHGRSLVLFMQGWVV